MSKKLSSKLHSGVVHLAGRTPASHKLVEELVEVDRETHHALFNRGLYHNHLSHQLSRAKLSQIYAYISGRSKVSWPCMI